MLVHIIKRSLVLLLLPLAATAQTVKRSSMDSLGGYKIILDKSGKLLPWYKPDVPGEAYAHVCKLASEFIKSGTPVDPVTGLPMYLVTCCFSGPHLSGEENFKAGKSGDDWMHNPAMVYAGMVHSLVLGYRVFSGDESYNKVVQAMLDYQLKHGTTPANWEWANVPYASSNPFEKEYMGATRWEKEGMRGDGLHGIEPDKVGELGLGYLLFYEVTEDTVYLNAAINCADALVKNIHDAGGDLEYFSDVQVKKSPWPFRINARNGVVIDEYCANVVEPVRLLDELMRIRQRISLTEEQYKAYERARNIAWRWLYSKNGPMKTSIWNAYFEDIPNDPERSNRNQVSPMETARYLLRKPGLDSNTNITVPALLYWVESVFGTENMDAIKEQTWCYVPMGSHTARFASICAMWYEKTGDERYKEKAYRYFNNATYCTDGNGVVRVGPTWPSSWFSDGYGDYIKHFLDGMAAVPEWAPAGEDHVLRSSSVVQKIAYHKKSIELSTFDSNGSLIIRMTAKPVSVTVNDIAVTHFKWKPLQKDGVLYLDYKNGNTIKITK
jgi:hypothetical protein